MEYVILLLISGVVVWKFYKNAKKPDSTVGETIAKLVSLKPDADPTEGDPFLAGLLVAKREAVVHANAAESSHRTDMEKRFSGDLAMKERLTKFAKENQIDKALAAVWDAIKYYPTWSKRDDWAKWNTLNLVGVGGGKSDDFKKSSVTFNYEGRNFEIVERKWSGMEGESYADLSLMEEGEEVFSVTCSHDSDNYPEYRPLSVLAFKKHGRWASMLMRLHGYVEAAAKKASIDSKYRSAEEARARFKE